MKFSFPKIKYSLVPLIALLLSGCAYGPIYPWAPCPAGGPNLIGCYYPNPGGPGPIPGPMPPPGPRLCAPPCGACGPCGFYGCTAYHPNQFYRCHNNRCVTYSPYAPNRCDPVPYYTGCKYTGCHEHNYSYYF